jgi:putative membrane protein
MVGLSRKMAAGARPVAEKTLRLMNEVPALLVAVIVGLVVLKPF